MLQIVRGFLRRLSADGATDAGSAAPEITEQQLLVLGEILLESDFVRNGESRDPLAIARRYLAGPPQTLKSALFEGEYYIDAANRRAVAVHRSADPLMHWLTVGSPRGLSPSPSFDADRYLAANPDVRAAGFPAFDHYILHGRREGRSLGLDGRSPELHPGEDAAGTSPGTALPAEAFELPEPIRAAIREQLARPGFAAGLKPFLEAAPALDNEEAQLLVRLFDLPFYVQTAKLHPQTSREEGLAHFLTTGILEGRSPSPLFDPAYYRRSVEASGLRLSGATPAFLHWLTVGRTRVTSPNPLFDAEFYARSSPDLAVGTDMFAHYALNGIREDRAPNILFDASWFRFHAWTAAGERTFADYLRVGPVEAGPPSRLVAAHAHRDLSLVTDESFADALAHISTLTSRLGLEATRLAIGLYSPRDPSELGRSWPGFVSYLERLAAGEDYEGPLFDPVLYRRKAAESEVKIAARGASFEHFLTKGRKLRLVPTEMFDEAFYRRTNSDLTNLPGWGFEHFVLHGLFEGRRPNGRPTLAITHPVNPPTAFVEGLRWRRQFESVLHHAPGSRSGASPIERVSRILMSDVFHEQMSRALALEPLIGDPMTIPQVLVPPLHDIAGSLNTALGAVFPKQTYDTVICIPWLRAGGADLVACLVAASVRRLFPDQSVLMLQMDNPAMERPDWIPADIDHVDISHLLTATDSGTAERLVQVALTGLQPRRVINVNSRLAWLTFQRFGRQLAQTTNLYGYLFCWDRTPEGAWAGYPSDFYAETAPHMTGILTDTDYLKAQLQRIYAPPPALAERIFPLYSPLRAAPPAGNAARTRALGRKRRRPRIIWAARMDRQKRFDILTAVARAMPEADFVVWGSALLDAPPDTNSLPSNMALKGPFKDYYQLELEDADVWLFTAEWEGLPTILIELGARGVPIVASAVGGVPELIRPDTGWPITDIEAIGDYVGALREAIANPEERIRRAEALQGLVGERHADAAYDSALAKALAKGEQA